MTANEINLMTLFASFRRKRLVNNIDQTIEGLHPRGFTVSCSTREAVRISRQPRCQRPPSAYALNCPRGRVSWSLIAHIGRNMPSQTTQSDTVAHAPLVNASVGTEQPWYAAYPPPRSEPQEITRHEMLRLLKGNTTKESAFVLVDLRRTDYEVKGCAFHFPGG